MTQAPEVSPTPYRWTVLDVAEFAYFDPIDDEPRTHEPFPLRAVLIDGDPWFVAYDVCRIVQWNMMPAVWSVDDDDRLKIPCGYLREGRSHLHPNGGGAVWFVSEPGFYRIALDLSVHPLRKRFKRWVTHEVIPTMRASGVSSARRTDLPMKRHRVVVDERRKTSNTKSHSLYRLYDKRGKLLYIGISLDAAARLSNHRLERGWWQQVASVRLEQHRTRDAVLAAEKAAIRAERPRYNVAMARRGRFTSCRTRV